MKLRTARKGPNAGQDFWGCSQYPNCKGTRPLEPEKDEISSIVMTELFTEASWPNPSGFNDAERSFLPAGAVRGVAGGPLFRSWNHVCVAYDGRSSLARLSPARASALNVVRRILGRGLAPPLPQAIANALPKPSVEAPEFARGAPDFGPAVTEDPTVRLFRKILPHEIRPDLFPFIHVGIPAAMLDGVDPVACRERLDLVLFHPSRSASAVAVKIIGHHGEGEGRLQEILSGAGHIFFALPEDEVRAGSGEKLQELFDFLNAIPSAPLWDAPAAAAGHAMTAMVEAIELGMLDLDAESWTIAAAGPHASAVAAGIGAFASLAKAVGELYGTTLVPPRCDIAESLDSSNGQPSLIVEWSDRESWFAPVRKDGTKAPRLTLRPVWLPKVGALPPPPVDWIDPDPGFSADSLRTILRFCYPGKEDFWEGQEDGIRRCLLGYDSLVLLPTGGGKSIIYQLSAMLLPGFSLVVAPLVSLMEDQVDNLRRAGIDRAIMISSTTTQMGKSEAISSLLKAGLYYLCYISPERLQIKSFRDDLVAIAIQMPVPLVVIDEAHCVSEWGHDFRPAYLNLTRNARNLGRRQQGKAPSIVGLTGTASRAVLRDLQNELRITDLAAVITPKSFNRPELSFEVVHQPSKNKPAALEGILRSLPSRLMIRPGDQFTPRAEQSTCGIVFCPHVKGEYGVESVAKDLEERFKIPVETYSGSQSAGLKTKSARMFKDNEAPLLVATKAFGMGIDKPNIRYTVHYGLPPSLEAFYQEAGRAGRDKKAAHCTLLVSVEDQRNAERLLDPSNDVVRLRKLYDEIPSNARDDIARVLWFHTEAFKGVRAEVDDIKAILDSFGPIEDGGKEILRFSEEEGPKEIEKGLHRLILIGIVADYTVDFRARKIEVQRVPIGPQDMRDVAYAYVASYSRSRADKLFSNLPIEAGMPPRQAAEMILLLLIGFIYETVEASRRAAIREVWRWTLLDNKDEVLRTRLVDYLQETEFSREVLDILREAEHDLARWRALLDKVSSIRDLQELDAGLARATEDFPDHPAIFAMRAIVSARRDHVADAAMFAGGCIRFLRSRYSDDRGLFRDYVEWILALLPDNDEGRQIIANRMCEDDDGTVCDFVFAAWRSDIARLGALPRYLHLLSDRLREFNESTKRGVK